MNNHLLFDFSVDKERRTIDIQREFDANIELVWQAWTTAELLDQWWGPQPWRAETKTMDFREGGFWLYAMISPEGDKHWSKANYITIGREKCFTQKDGFCDENGTMKMELPQNFVENNFSEKDHKTKVGMMLTFATLADLETIVAMGFEEGMTTDFNQLDNLLSTIKK